MAEEEGLKIWEELIPTTANSDEDTNFLAGEGSMLVEEHTNLTDKSGPFGPWFLDQDKEKQDVELQEIRALVAKYEAQGESSESEDVEIISESESPPKKSRIKRRVNSDSETDSE